MKIYIAVIVFLLTLTGCNKNDSSETVPTPPIVKPYHILDYLNPTRTRSDDPVFGDIYDVNNTETLKTGSIVSLGKFYRSGDYISIKYSGDLSSNLKYTSFSDTNEGYLRVLDSRANGSTDYNPQNYDKGEHITVVKGYVGNDNKRIDAEFTIIDYIPVANESVESGYPQYTDKIIIKTEWIEEDMTTNIQTRLETVYSFFTKDGGFYKRIVLYTDGTKSLEIRTNNFSDWIKLNEVTNINLGDCSKFCVNI